MNLKPKTNYTLSVKMLLVASSFSIFGTSFAFIPISKFFSSYFSIGIAWAVVLFICKIPVLVIGSTAAKLANRYSAAKVIYCSQFVAFLFSVIFALCLVFENIYFALFSFVCVSFSSKTSEILLPSFLNLLAKDKAEVQRNMSNLKILRYAAFLLGIPLGGVLFQKLPIASFVFVDSFTFLGCAVVWMIFGQKLKAENNAIPEPLPFSKYKDLFWLRLNKFLVLKKVLYGIFQPLVSVLFLTVIHGATEVELGYAYLVMFAGTLAGAQTYKYIPVRIKTYGWATILEVIFMVGGILSPNLGYSMLSLTMMSFFMSVADVGTQTHYLLSNKDKNSHYLCSAFESCGILGVLIGNVSFALFLSDKSMYVSGLVFAIVGLLSLWIAFTGKSKNLNPNYGVVS